MCDEGVRFLMSTMYRVVIESSGTIIAADDYEEAQDFEDKLHLAVRIEENCPKHGWTKVDFMSGSCAICTGEFYRDLIDKSQAELDGLVDGSEYIQDQGG